MARPVLSTVIVLVFLAQCNGVAWADSKPAEKIKSEAIKSALVRAGENRSEIQQALKKVPAAQRAGMRFLIANMPKRDLKSLKAAFLLENVRLSYEAWNKVPWKDDVSQDVFFNNILPYTNINEQRDPWRAEFKKKFWPLVKDAKTSSEAAAILNQKIFPMLKVRYSTKRPKADQSPQESIEAGLASCTGLSIVLIGACRSVGVPARFVGTPLWSDRSGNHSWVEVWDNGWQFTGAAEATGDQLNRAWFTGRAAKAKRDHRYHAIYAVSYKRTPQTFPFPWDRSIDYVYAVNVTDRYTRRPEKIPTGSGKVMFRLRGDQGPDRAAAKLKITSAEGKVMFEGTTKDERFDANDHLTAVLPLGKTFSVECRVGDRVITQNIVTGKDGQLFTFKLDPEKR